MKRLVVVLALLSLSGCVSVQKMEAGNQKLGERLSVTLEGAWNHLNAPGLGPAQVWTMEGTPVDQLLFYTGLPDDELIHAMGPRQGDSEPKAFRFRASMSADEIASLFQGMLTRDGSRYTLEKLEPMDFGGIKGFRFEFTLIRKAGQRAPVRTRLWRGEQRTTFRHALHGAAAHVL